MGRLIDITIKRCETKLTGYFPQPNNWIYNEEEIPRKIGIKRDKTGFKIAVSTGLETPLLFYGCK